MGHRRDTCPGLSLCGWGIEEDRGQQVQRISLLCEAAQVSLKLTILLPLCLRAAVL